MSQYIFLTVFVFTIGLVIGSFLNVLIDRLPKEEKITGRSHCDYCKKKLTIYDLVPVFSFIFLGGRCRYCRKKLSFQYPLVEIFTGLSFVLITNYQILITKQFSMTNFQFPNVWLLSNWSLFVSWLLFLGIFSCFIVIFFSDLKYNLISDYILWALFIFSFFYQLLANFNQFQLILTNYLPSGLAVAAPIYLIYYLSKEKAMGLGDVYLSAAVGLLLGFKAGFLALYIAFVTGAVLGAFLIILKKKKLKSKVPFGPFIVIGSVVMLFWGERFLGVIKRIYGF